MRASNVVDWDDPDHNMYGCAPCPKCGGKYRAAYRRAGMVVLSIECECGHTEPAAPRESGET
jgi:hypothetical protein